MKKLIGLLVVILGFISFNVHSQIKEQVYISSNNKGVDEILILKMLPDGNVQELTYSTSKSKKQTKLIISKQTKNYLEIMFPGEKVVYKLKLNGESMVCDNPDKTSQNYYLSNKVKSTTLVVEGTITGGGQEEGAFGPTTYLEIKDLKNKVIYLPPIMNYDTFKINGIKLFIDDQYKLNPEFKNKKVKLTCKIDKEKVEVYGEATELETCTIINAEFIP